MIRTFAIAGGALLLTLAGCGLLSTPTSSDDSVDPVVPAAHDLVEIPDGVVATGDLTSVAGEAIGEVRIIKDGSTYHFDVPEFVTLTNERPMTLALSDSPFEPTECGDANIWQIGIGDQATLDYGLDAATFSSGDWSFITSVVVVGHLDPVGDCQQPILAIAPLTWDQPVVRPWVDPVDSGAAVQAEGRVDGTLYTTAAGDNFDAIAARFGIGPDDLEWLNPIRTPGQTRWAYADQVLNLDPDDRSDSESRRPQ
jgi:hypothetical protein